MLGRGSRRGSRLARMRRRRSGGCWVLGAGGFASDGVFASDGWLMVSGAGSVDGMGGSALVSGSGSVSFFLFFVGSVARA